MSTTIVVTKNEEGKLVGVGRKAATALLRFERWCTKLVPGEIFTIEVWFPRNPKFMGFHFVMLGQFFDAQEQFDDEEHLRMWLQTGAGYCKLYPGPSGKPVAIADSISFKKMDENTFSEHHARVKAFMRSVYCTRFLWPHLQDHEASAIVEGILEGFERER